MTQIVADPDSPAFKSAETVRGEWVIRVDGEVKARMAEAVNPNLPTGEIEIFAKEIEVLSAAKELPLPVFGEPDYPEDIRLKYRFLDLRRETLHCVRSGRPSHVSFHPDAALRRGARRSLAPRNQAGHALVSRQLDQRAW